jgi:hypothetical protein
MTQKTANDTHLFQRMNRADKTQRVSRAQAEAALFGWADLLQDAALPSRLSVKRKDMGVAWVHGYNEAPANEDAEIEETRIPMPEVYYARSTRHAAPFGTRMVVVQVNHKLTMLHIVQ